MPRRDPQKCDRGPFRLPSSLLPVAQGVNADLDRAGELRLSQTDEASQRCDVLPGFETSLNQALSESGRNCSLELFIGQFGDFCHLC